MMQQPDFHLTSQGYTYDYPRAAMTADNVILGFDGQSLRVLLVRRAQEPFAQSWALPGGFLHMEETVEDCARRELQEETGVQQVELYPVGVFSQVDRDPRGRVITFAYYALIGQSSIHAGDDASEARWFTIHQLPTLAFDHQQIIQAALQRLREDVHFRPVGFDLLPEHFTMPQLQHLYEAILQVQFDRRNFMKKMLATQILTPTGTSEQGVRHRAAVYYRFHPQQYEQYKQKRNFCLEF